MEEQVSLKGRVFEERFCHISVHYIILLKEGLGGVTVELVEPFPLDNPLHKEEGGVGGDPSVFISS